MIDIENEIFTRIVTELRSRFPDINVYGEDVRTPSSFPCVSIVEADNYALTNTRDSGSNENHAVLMYEINVYSNRTSGKKSECKAIIALIDTEMTAMGFVRSTLTPIQNEYDSTIYRMVGRYRAAVSHDYKIYRR